MAKASRHVRTGVKVLLYGIASGVYQARSLLARCCLGERPKKRVLVVEVTQKEPSNSYERILPALQTRNIQTDFYSWGKLRVSKPRLLARTLHLAWKAACADVIFLCEACSAVGCIRLRQDVQVVQLWHACGAFKRFGMSTADKRFGASRKEKQLFAEHKNTTLVTVSSPEVCWAYVEALDMASRPEVVQPLGISRTDGYFDASQKTAWREHALGVVPQIEGKRVLLWAPTFRGQTETATAPDFLDLDALRERLGEDWCVLVKHHPHVKELPPIPDSCAGFAFDVSESLSIEAAMTVADVCVTDYSSLVFEWSLLNRPVAFLAPDIDDYDDWRGFYYDYDSMTPGPVFARTEDLAEWLCRLPQSFDEAALAEFRQKFMSSCDGHATERIMDMVFGQLGEARLGKGM